LSQEGKDGSTEAEHLAAYARATGETPDELATYLAGPPNGTESVWLAFKEMNRTRGNNGYGPSPISWEAIAAYGSLLSVSFNPWEIELIGELDQLAMQFFASRKKDK
jgi:hypothetical protein